MALSIGHLPEKVKAFLDEHAIGPRLREGAMQALDLIYPRQPLSHDPDIRNYAGPSVSVQASGLDAGDWAAIRFLGDDGCDMCARLFEGGLHLGTGALCDDCTKTPFPFKRGRAACIYGEASKGLILAFKHADRLDLRPVLLGWLSRAGAGIMPDIDVIVPVPLHVDRLFQRRYNQACELARPLARAFHKDFEPDGLRRVRPTHQQGGSLARTAKGRRADRYENVKNAFAVTPAGQRHLRGRHVLLIDDVFTSGATLSACATELLKAGARQVDVLVLARAVPASLL
ncbi:ComF family protein [Asticcacaulis sp. BYS171W]|uniref:ComF family protein n=1 Tax=Asticcacaulis aquaticus TaxID=2984212 RepID=A0ABT5HSV6_9CAUL|nr:ComF family protein [Asticcacaulis aquaticus]